MTMRWSIVAVVVGCIGVASCVSSGYGVKQDTWITDCDTLTQELARIYQGMDREEVVRVLGNESWVLSRHIDKSDRYRQVVLYNFNGDCLKLRGKSPPRARRIVMIEYADDVVDRIVDRPVNQRR